MVLVFSLVFFFDCSDFFVFSFFFVNFFVFFFVVVLCRRIVQPERPAEFGDRPAPACD